MRHVVLLTVMLALPGSASAQDTLEGTFAAANAAYARGENDAAAEGYERLVEAGVDDPDVYYDLGLAHARRGAHGRAIAAFERSLRLSPRDPEALAALEASRGLLGRRRAEREGEAIVDSGPPTLDALFGWASEDLLAGSLLAFEAILLIALLGLVVVRGERARIALGIVAPVAGLLLAGAIVGLISRTGALDPGPAAIVIREGAPLREGPSADARERHGALEGERVYVTGQDGEFLRVEAGGRVGWIASADVVPL